jgi:hypothetical protein
MGVNVGGQVQQRLGQPPPLDEEQRDQQTPDAAIPVQERVNRLEVLMHQAALDEV